MKLFTNGNLSREQESFDQFAFPANGKARKVLKPFTLWNDPLGRKPVGKLSEVLRCDLAVSNAFDQVRDERFRQLSAADFRHLGRRRRKSRG